MKAFKWISTAIILLALLSGCATSNSSGSSENGGSATNGNTDPANKETVTLSFYDWFDEEPYMTEVIKAFEAKNPDIKIKANFVPSQEYGQKILVNLSTSEGIDVFLTATPGAMAEYADKKTLLELDPDVPEVSGVKDMANDLQIDGKVYGYPYRISSWVLYYNKDIFDAASVPYPDDTWTWEKYREVANQLTSGEGQEKIYGSLSYQSTSAWWRIPANTKGANNPNDPDHLNKFLETAQYIHELTYADGAQQPYGELVGQAGADYTGRFLQGKTAMMFNGDWGVEMLNRAIAEKGMDFKYDIAPLPYWQGQEPATGGTAALAMVSNKTKYPEESKRFAAFIASEEAAKIMAGSGLLTAWSSDEVTKVFQEKLTQPEHADAFYARKIFSQVPIDPLYGKGMKIMTDEVSLYLLNEKSLDETRAKIEERIKNEVK